MDTFFLAVVAAAVLLAVIVIFNRLVSRKHRVAAALSDIDVQLKRRHDLVPKLVDAVKAYGRFEQSLLNEVTALRHSALSTEAAGRRGAQESALSRHVTQLLAVAEAYPELKASETYLELLRNLTEVENHIQYARRYYNGAVQQLNVMIQQFPSSIVARLLDFRAADYFEVELATERQSRPLEF